MRRILVPAAALALAASTLTGCGGGSSQAAPRGAVVAYYAALQSDHPASACAFKADDDCSRFLYLTPQNVRVAGLTIGKAQIHGDTATVSVSLTSWAMADSSGGPTTETDSLVRKADGKWYLS
ncbi:MAG TPA: hypothetical protein VF317_12870 [Dermatophilaceae bacterium]